MAETVDRIRDKLVKELAAVHVVGFWPLFVLLWSPSVMYMCATVNGNTTGTPFKRSTCVNIMFLICKNVNAVEHNLEVG